MFKRLLLYGLLLAAVANAQGGNVTGRVTDLSGAGIANATLLFKQVEGGMTRQATTGPDGSFTIPDLPTGSYNVELASSSGRHSTTQAVRIDAANASTLALTFNDIGGADGGKIEVEGRAPTLQTESAEVSRAYGTIVVRQLPVLDRQAQELVGLMPGITPPVTNEDSIADPQRQREFNVNGLPSYANAYFQDGAYQTEPFSGKAVRIAPNESIQSLNVRTSNYNAEHGFSGGSAANTVTRPGQNQVHGSVFGFHTNNFFGTRSPLNNQGDANDARFNQNQFGGSLGGPLRSDSVFLFGAYEGFLRRGRIFSLGTVPTASMREGDFSEFPGAIYNPNSGLITGAGRTPFPGNRIPAASISPLASGLMENLPLPNRSGFSNNLSGSPFLRTDNHRGDLKLDHRFSERSYGFFRYGFTQADVERESLLGALGDGASAALRNHNGVAALSYSLTPKLIGEIRVGYSRYRNLISPLAPGSELSALLQDSGFADGVPSINISGLSGFGLAGNYPSKPISNIYDGATNWSHHSARHHLKFGASGRVFRSSGFDPGSFSPRGSFVFGPGGTSLAGRGISADLLGNSFASFLTGRASQSGVSAFSTTPTYEQEHYSAHLTDTLNLWSRVYLELGVRYDVYSPVRTRNTASNQIYDPMSGQVTGATVNSLYDLNNVAPRVGIAIRPFDRLAVRAGYGLLYFPLPYALSGSIRLLRAHRSVRPGNIRLLLFPCPPCRRATRTISQATFRT